MVGNPAEVGHAEHALHVDPLCSIRANIDTGCGQQGVNACFWLQSAQQHLTLADGNDDIVVEVMIDDSSPCFFHKRRFLLRTVASLSALSVSTLTIVWPSLSTLSVSTLSIGILPLTRCFSLLWLRPRNGWATFSRPGRSMTRTGVAVAFAAACWHLDVTVTTGSRHNESPQRGRFHSTPTCCRTMSRIS